jgi:hypothetical protein
LRQALSGRFRTHHAFLLSQILAHVDYIEEAIETVSQQIGVLLTPFADAVERLSTIPGVKQRRSARATTRVPANIVLARPAAVTRGSARR